MMVRATGRVVLVILSAGLVIFVTYAAVPHSDPKPASNQATRFTMDQAMPGGADAVHRAISDIRNGRQLPEEQWLVSALGPLETLSYTGAGDRGDHYLASFQKGSLLWNVSVDDSGKIKGLTFDAPNGPTPQDWIDHYALIPAGVRVALLIPELIKILAVIGIGRLVGIRL